MPIDSDSRPSLVIVDDEEGIRELVARIARDAGFDASMLADSRQLFSALDQMIPDIIILDLNMEGQDGIQILGELARRTTKTPIVLFSGSDVRLLEMAKELGEAQGLAILAALQKPVRIASLLEVLDKVRAERAAFDANSLRQRIRDNTLQLHYQPKLSLSTYEITGCEALLRCNDVAGRAVAPDEVIAIAEGANLIDELTVWVFRSAVSQIREWREAGLPLSVAVNLSAQSATNTELPALFAATCQENNIQNSEVTIEITESAAMDEALVSRETLIRLRVKGFHLSVDDFGTGYSSLLRLRSLPFTEVKIDKSFVINMPRSKDDAAIMSAIISLTKRLDLHCVIEGAETQEAIDYASSLGCDEAQGYFISKAVPSNEMPGFIKTWQWRKNSMPRRAIEEKSVAPDAFGTQ